MAFEEVPDKPTKGIWKPKMGEFIEGEIIHAEAGKYGLEHVLRTKEGSEVKLPSHKQLQSKLEDLKTGQYIRVTKIGEKASAKGQATQMYKVEVDRSYVPQKPLILPVQAMDERIKGILANLKFGQDMFPGHVIPEVNVIAACGDPETFKRLKDMGLIIGSPSSSQPGTSTWRVP